MNISVLIVDDSAFMRKIIKDILSKDNEIKVVGTAVSGEDALKKIKTLKPDIVTLDIEMPVMNGIECLKRIMDNYNLPVIMLSSLTVEGADTTMKALDLGAIDFIAKPTSIFSMDNEDKKIEIIQKVKIASMVKINRNKLKNIKEEKIQQKEKIFITHTHNKPYIIAIGSSTGGPRALQNIIPYINKDINGSIVVVQHMPPNFTKSLANRLDSLSEIKVKEAQNGEKLCKGVCYIAPGNFHMVLDESNSKEIHIKLNKNESVSGHRPSVDVMMNSVATIKSMNKLGVILTGMGSDGTEGMINIKNNKGYNIAQNEETCVVYGMPKSVVRKDAANKILPLNEIASEIKNRVGC